MNAKQTSTWKQLVRQCKTQCKSRFYSRINIASKVRSDAIVAADALVELVTPELVTLLEDLALESQELALEYGYDVGGRRQERAEQAYALAARIRGALEANGEN